MKLKKKIYIPDTNVLIQSPYAIFAFEENDVVLADITLEELDGLKNRPGEVGANAREANRLLEGLRRQGSLVRGVALPGGGTLRIEVNHLKCELPAHWSGDIPDNRILRVCKGIREETPKSTEVILVSQDIAMRLKADLIGVTAEDYRADRVDEKPYAGRAEGYVSKSAMAEFYRTGRLSADAVRAKGPAGEDGEGHSAGLFWNEFWILHEDTAPGSTALARFDGSGFVALQPWEKRHPYGVKPRNVGQKFALEALMLPAAQCPLVILSGAAGTAKTFLCLAAGLEQVLNAPLEERRYKRILVARPNVKFDDTIGFLKGSEEDKIGPLIRPIMDNLELLTQARECEPRPADGDAPWRAPAQPKRAKNIYTGAELNDAQKNAALGTGYVRELFDQGIIVAQAMEYMRGRSVTDTYIIIDEAQNMTPTQAFGIISRAGVGSKVILTGDPDQIDNPHLDKRSNGLSWAANRMKGSPLCAQIRFEESECTRSALAKEAVERLSPKGYGELGK